ncbi:MAG TPA: AAA family ATPase [Thermoplasmata archaeon]|nr:AAA family ATPase [Thermoplasmata archaeon]
MRAILEHEETLDPAFLPPRLVHRERELARLLERYRTSLSRGNGYHQLLTGGVGSGKTALATRLGTDLQGLGRLSGTPVHRLYINCWRRANDRSIMLELLRGVGVSLPDRGYGLSEMLDVFEQGIRKEPRHLFIILDEVSAVIRQGTKLVYLLSRSREIRLGSISLFLVAPEDVLPYLDAASRSSFGVTHRLRLEPYSEAQLVDILKFRAQLALRPGSVGPEVLHQIARIATTSGDARFALELLAGAAHTAEEAGRAEVGAEDVRTAKGSLLPTLTESKLDGLTLNQLFALLALSRTLRNPRANATTERVRQTYGALAEEYQEAPVSRVTFWRTVRELEREGLVDLQPGRVGESARLAMDELPASLLVTLLEERIAESRARKT